MGIILVLIGILVISVLALVIPLIIEKCTEGRFGYSFYAPNELITISIGGIALSILALIICGVVIGIVQSKKQVEYDNMLYRKEVLEYRLENGEDLYGNKLLYKDITSFNNTLRSEKYWASNKWTNWFNNDLLLDIDYIEYTLKGE